MFAILRREKSLVSAIVAYYAMLLAIMIASFLPEYRVWGLGHWTHYPDAIRFVLFGLGMLAPVIALFFARNHSRSEKDQSVATNDRAGFGLFVAAITVIFCALFYFLRARTHFDGDGYLLLSLLAEGSKAVKFTNIGETLIHNFLFSMLSGENTGRALLSYQLVSWFAGVVFVLATCATAWKMFSGLRERILFVLATTSGGYMLLFFGHAENYSLFVMMVGLFSLAGLLVAKGKLNRWLILIPFVGALFLHIFGVTLIPAAIYLIVSQTKLSRWIVGLNVRMRIALVVVGTAAVAAGFGYFYVTRYYFQFAFVPLWENRFTTNGYTFFSINHWLDIINLVLMLFPGLLVLAVSLPKRRSQSTPARMFLLVLILSTLGAVALFDPKLGMPRDWDLFAFCGIPLALLAFIWFTENRNISGARVGIIALAIVIGIFSLFSRAYSVVDPDLSVKRVKSNINLDPLRNRGTLNVLVDYYRNLGDTAAADAEFASWETQFPEWAINRYGQRLVDRREYVKSLAYFREAISINPSFSVAYANIGSAYIYLKQYDSAIAYFAIADGMNYGSAPQLSNFGAAYYYMGEYDKATEILQRAIELDPKAVAARMTMAMIYRKTDYADEYLECLIGLSKCPAVPVNVLEELTAIHLRNEDYEQAAEVIKLALAKGMDSTYVQALKMKYPQLPL